MWATNGDQETTRSHLHVIEPHRWRREELEALGWPAHGLRARRDPALGHRQRDRGPCDEADATKSGGIPRRRNRHRRNSDRNPQKPEPDRAGSAAAANDERNRKSPGFRPDAPLTHKRGDLEDGGTGEGSAIDASEPYRLT